MKKKGLAILLTICIAFGLSACGENVIPEMTDEELQAVGEYAAITLMKYDANHRSRLVDISLLEEEKTEPALPTPTVEPADKEEGMKPVDDTPIANQAEKENAYSMEEVLGLPDGITVSYVNHEFYKKYPEDGENDYFAITPSTGKKLLALTFALNNISGQDRNADLLSAGCIFKITVNGDYTRRALTTMLPNDMSVYAGTIAAGESQEVVLLIEIEEDRVENLSSIVLNLKNESKTYTIQLF